MVSFFLLTHCESFFCRSQSLFPRISCCCQCIVSTIISSSLQECLLCLLEEAKREPNTFQRLFIRFQVVFFRSLSLIRTRLTDRESEKGDTQRKTDDDERHKSSNNRSRETTTTRTGEREQKEKALETKQRLTFSFLLMFKSDKQKECSYRKRKGCLVAKSKGTFTLKNIRHDDKRSVTKRR